MYRGRRFATLIPVLILSLGLGCVAEESDVDPFDSEVADTGNDKGDELAALTGLTGFIVLGDGDTMPEGRAALFDVDGIKLADIDVDEYVELSQEGTGSLFASPVFEPAEGRELEVDDNPSFAPSGSAEETDLKTPTSSLNRFNCTNLTHFKNQVLPPCDGRARWVTPRTFSKPADYAYLIYKYEYIDSARGDEYPFGERSWWGWGNTVELHKASYLWRSTDGKYKKTEAIVPVSSKFEFDEARLKRTAPHEVNGETRVIVFLRLPLVFTGD